MLERALFGGYIGGDPVPQGFNQPGSGNGVLGANSAVVISWGGRTDPGLHCAAVAA